MKMTRRGFITTATATVIAPMVAFGKLRRTPEAEPFAQAALEGKRPNLWVGLVGSNGKEIAGNGYQRVSVEFDPAKIRDGQAVSAASVEFPEAQADWGEIAGFVICQSPAAGIIIADGRFEAPRQIDARNSVHLDLSLG